MARSLRSQPELAAIFLLKTETCDVKTLALFALLRFVWCVSIFCRISKLFTFFAKMRLEMYAEISNVFIQAIIFS